MYLIYDINVYFANTLRCGRGKSCRRQQVGWVHKAGEMPTEDFRREVEKELTGAEEEPSQLIYFKGYKSQIPAIEQAIETAARMLGSDKSRGYCLEMICADFAGAHLDNGNPESAIMLAEVASYSSSPTPAGASAVNILAAAAKRKFSFAWP